MTQRKRNILTVVVVIAGLVVLVLVTGIVGYIETHYTREAEVIELESDSVVVVEDATGNEWAFEGEGYAVGDKVTMKMHTNGTDSIITDDVIENVKLR